MLSQTFPQSSDEKQNKFSASLKAEITKRFGEKKLQTKEKLASIALLVTKKINEALREQGLNVEQKKAIETAAIKTVIQCIENHEDILALSDEAILPKGGFLHPFWNGYLMITIARDVCNAKEQYKSTLRLLEPHLIADLRKPDLSTSIKIERMAVRICEELRENKDLNVWNTLYAKEETPIKLNLKPEAIKIIVNFMQTTHPDIIHFPQEELLQFAESKHALANAYQVILNAKAMAKTDNLKTSPIENTPSVYISEKFTPALFPLPPVVSKTSTPQEFSPQTLVFSHKSSG